MRQVPRSFVEEILKKSLIKKKFVFLNQQTEEMFFKSYQKNTKVTKINQKNIFVLTN